MNVIKCVSAILIVIGLMNTAYGQTEEQERSPPEAIEWKDYNSTRLGLSIDYPSTWNIQEKQNRFEEGSDLTIESFVAGGAGQNQTVQLIDSDFIHFSVDLDEAATAAFTNKTNIIALTNSLMDEILDHDFFEDEYERRLIEGVNTSRYKIGGENAGSFVTVNQEREEQDSYNNSSSNLGLAEEWVVTVHNNQVYVFLFMATPEVFDTQRVTEIGKHMFDSIKWLD